MLLHESLDHFGNFIWVSATGLKLSLILKYANSFFIKNINYIYDIQYLAKFLDADFQYNYQMCTNDSIKINSYKLI